MVSIPAPIAQIAPDGKLTVRQKRRVFLDMALRHIRPGTGSSHEFMLRRTAMTDWPDLRKVLQGVDWVIVGGVATRAYMPERMTKDIDILVRQRDGVVALEALQTANYKVITPLAVPGYLLMSPDGVELDIIFSQADWVDEALAHPHADIAGYPVLDLPYLVLMKIDTGRGRDFGDVTTMLGWADERDLNRVRQVVARYQPQDLDDLESLIYLGQQERQT
jgi:hypothetical protein